MSRLHQKQNNPSEFRGLFKITNQIAGKWRQRVSCGKFCNFCFQNFYSPPPPKKKKKKMDEFNFKPTQYPVKSVILKNFKLLQNDAETGAIFS